MYNSSMKGLLEDMGLPYDSSDEAASAFYEALSDDLKTEIKSKLDAVAAAAQAEADKATLADRTKPENMAALSAALAAAKSKGAGTKKKPTDVNPEQMAQLALANQQAQLVAEGQRVTMLKQLGSTLTVSDEVVQLAIAEGDDVSKAQVRYLKALKDKCKPVEGLNGLRVGEDRKIAALSIAMPDALVIRAGYRKFVETDDKGRVVRDRNGGVKPREAHEMATKFADLSALDMYRQWLIGMGAPGDQINMLSRPRLAQLLRKRDLAREFPMVAQLAQSTSDFDNLLLDAQNKTLRMGYVEAARSWTLWAKRGTAPDFKNINRPQWSEIPTPTNRKEGQPLQYVTISDSKEVYVLEKYDAGVRLTWQALINDDMNVFGDIPFKLGQACSRLEDNVAYGVITSNGVMSDTGALFNNTPVTTAGGHANYVATGSVGAPSVATVSATEKLMMLQMGPKNAAFLDLTPKFCIVPVALKTVAEQFFASKVDPTKSNETPNPYNGRVQVVSTARLDAASTTAWHLLADYRDGIDTVEVCFLSDMPEPQLRQETGFEDEDAKYAIKHVVAAKALEFRGMSKNAGA